MFVGAENWALPIPLVKHQGAWYFDTAAGKNEILYRRMGQNELAAMDARIELVQAEQQYFAHPPDGSSNQYSKELPSDVDSRDGPYREAEPSTSVSPLIAHASVKGPGNSVGDQAPYSGYFFRILTGQGVHAAGGAKNYVVDGNMTGGFAFVAYHAVYRSSGVMTFLVSQDGTIFERHLGPNTKKTAEALTMYDPDSNWHKAPSE